MSKGGFGLGFLSPPGSGGGAPPGDGTVWPSVAEWADLDDIAGPLRDGDSCFVVDMDGAGSAGFAQYDDVTEVWQLFLGRFATVTLMRAFAEPILTEATALVTDPDVEQANWTYATSTVAAGAGGGSVSRWLPDEVARAVPTVQAYLVGTEAVPSVGGTVQGLSRLGGGAATLTQVGDEHVLATGGNGTFAAYQTTFTFAPGTRYYIEMECRVSASSGNATLFHVLYTGVGSNPAQICTQNASLASGHYIPSNTTSVLVGSLSMIEAGGQALATSDPELLTWTSLQDDVGRLMTVHRKGRPYFSIRRNAQSESAVGQFLVQVFSGGGSMTAEIKNFYVYTW